MEQIAALYRQLHSQAKAHLDRSNNGSDMASIQAAWGAIQVWRNFVVQRVDAITAAGFDTVQQQPVAPLSWPIGGQASACYREFLRMEKQMNWLVNKYHEGRVTITVTGSNNVVSGGSISQSPVQQGNTGQSTQNVTFNCPPDAELQRFVNEMRQHLAELGLSQADDRKVLAQLATIEAQLADEPNPSIVQAAGKTIKNVAEGAIGSLIATAAQPGVWAFIQSVLSVF